MAARTVHFKVRRIEDGKEIELLMVYRKPEDKLADVASPDGRSVYTTDETNIYFADEPNRPMQEVEAEATLS